MRCWSLHDDQAKIEVLGLKFNASSGSFIVFLVGSALLVGTALAPDHPSPSQKQLSSSSATFGEGKATGQGKESQKTAIKLPDNAETLELEPNNSKDQANQISTDIMFRGSLDAKLNDSEDWFAIPTGHLENGYLDVKIVQKEGFSKYCVISAYGEEEEEALHSASLSSSEEAIHQRYNISGLDVLFLRFSCGVAKEWNEPKDGYS